MERVKDASDIVRIIGEHVALRPKGREFLGLCPFHDDHTPSLNVVPHKQFYKCFSCGAAGDVLTFVQQFLKMEFREALEYLADRAGIVLQNLAPATSEEGAAGPTKSQLLEANRIAADFYRAVLQHGEHGRGARGVVEKRGIGPEAVREFQIGAAPDRWDGLLLTMQGKEVEPRVLEGAGLVKSREQGQGHYDAFRNRLMFPICDRTGRVIAFGARRIDENDEPKYLNSPETRLFNKSGTLYALHHALRAIQQTRTAVICEGYLDVIACHEAGFRNAIATLGTALTTQHARELRLAADRVLLLFDSDEAGQRAADRAAEVFFAEPLDVAIVALDRFTTAKDPDELLRSEGGKTVFARALEGAEELLEYRLGRVKARLAGASLSALSRGVEEEVDRLVQLGLANVQPIRRDLIVRRLAAIAGVSEATIRSVVPAGRGASRVGGAPGRWPSATADSAQPPALHEVTLDTREHLLGCLLCDGALWGTLREDEKDLIAPGVYRFPVLQRVAQVVHDLGEDGSSPDIRAVLDCCPDSQEQQAAIAVMSQVHEETQGESARIRAHWGECLRRAKLDRAHAVRMEPSPADGTAAVDRIMALRTVRSTLGADQRRLPRPG